MPSALSSRSFAAIAAAGLSRLKPSAVSFRMPASSRIVGWTADFGWSWRIWTTWSSIVWYREASSCDDSGDRTAVTEGAAGPEDVAAAEPVGGDADAGEFDGPHAAITVSTTIAATAAGRRREPGSRRRP